MNMILSIKEIPVPKGRPRFWNGHAVTPPKTREYEKLVKAEFRKHYKGDPLETPLSVKMVFGMPIPKSFSKKDTADAISHYKQHTKRPDVDNLLKAVMDALNGECWKDDSQIVELQVWKEYASTPYIEIRVDEVIPKRGGEWF